MPATSLAIALVLAAAPKMVVVDTVDVSAKDATAARVCTQILVGEASGLAGYHVIGPNEIAQMLGMERQRQLAGCSDASASCMAELSDALGADLILSSQLSHVGSQYRIDVRLVDSHKGQIIAGAGDFFPATEEAAATGTQRLARTVLARAPVEQGAPAAVVPQSAVETAAPRKGHSLLSKVVLGVAAAALVGGVVVTSIASVNYSSLNGAATARDRPTYDMLFATQQTLNPVADGLWIGAAVTAVAGLLLWFLL
jgi:hypothetical protein